MQSLFEKFAIFCEPLCQNEIIGIYYYVHPQTIVYTIKYIPNLKEYDI